MKPTCLLLGAACLCLAPAARSAEPKKPAEEKKAKVYQVPYHLTDTQHVLVRAKINGKGPFNFIIDTGAPTLFVSIPVAKKLGLEMPDDKDKDKKKVWTVLDRFEMEGGAAQEKVKCRVETPFQLEGMNAMGLAGMELHGIIGYTVLAHYKMEFDFTRDKMTWVQLDFAPPEPKAFKLKDKDAGGVASMEMLGSVMKALSWLSGLGPAPLPVPRGFVGLEVADNAGVVSVKSVIADGPAAKVGLKPSDRITQVQGRDVASFTDVVRGVAGVRVGQTVTLTVLRGDDKHQIKITAGEGL